MTGTDIDAVPAVPRGPMRVLPRGDGHFPHRRHSALGSPGRGAASCRGDHFGPFFVLVELGWVRVVMVRPSKVDLSILVPMTLSAAIEMRVMAGAGALSVPSLLALLWVGLAVGTANHVLVRLLCIPSNLAALLTSLVVQSTAIQASHSLRMPSGSLMQTTIAQPPTVLRTAVPGLPLRSTPSSCDPTTTGRCLR